MVNAADTERGHRERWIIGRRGVHRSDRGARARATLIPFGHHFLHLLLVLRGFFCSRLVTGWLDDRVATVAATCKRTKPHRQKEDKEARRRARVFQRYSPFRRVMKRVRVTACVELAPGCLVIP